MRFSAGINRVAMSITLAILGLALSYLMYRYMGVGGDWHLFYWPIPRAWLAGQTHLYDAASELFYNPPWLIPMILPMAMLPEAFGLAIYRLIELVIVSYAIFRYAPVGRRKMLSLVLVALSIQVWGAIIIGNVDLIVLLGLVLLDIALAKRQPWLLGLALVLATIKPQLSVIPLVIMLPSLRHWTRKDIQLSLVLPLIAFYASFYIAGLDWPLRLLDVMIHGSPALKWDAGNLLADISLYRLWNVLGLPVGEIYLVMVLLLGGLLWHCRRLDNLRDRLAIGIAAGPLIIPYTTPPGLALAMIVAWPRLIERRHYLAAAVVYAAQFLLILRGFPGFSLLGTSYLGISWVLVLCPICLTIGLLLPAKVKTEGARNDSVSVPGGTGQIRLANLLGRK